MSRKPVFDEQILALPGLTREQIAERLGCCAGTVTDAWRRAGVSKKHRNQPISAERLALAAKCISDGWSWNEIYKTHGISAGTLKKHFPGTQWSKKQINEHISLVQSARHRGLA